MTGVLLILLALAAATGRAGGDHASGYATEVRALGGAAVHDTIASAETCEVSTIRDAAFDGEARFVVIAGPIVPSGEVKHMLTQGIGTAARRGHQPAAPAEPTHLVRFKRGKRVVDVLVSTSDGSFRVMYSGRVVATLGEKKYAAQWSALLPAALGH